LTFLKTFFPLHQYLFVEKDHISVFFGSGGRKRRLTEEIVKRKINDGNGGNGYLFWQLFIRLDDLKFDQEKYQKEFDIKIESLKKIICPIHEENVNRKNVNASVKKIRISFSSWITFIILVIIFIC
jgi:hypothetical protein